MRARLAVALFTAFLAATGAIAWRIRSSTKSSAKQLAASDSSSRFPNILLISIDTLRADHLSCYGYDRPTSPNIDRLARDGVLFEKVVSTTSWTLPAHLSMLTSLFPDAHGVVQERMRLPDKAVVCSEILKENGFSTYAVVSAPFLNHQFGYSQGFDVYEDFTQKGETTPLSFEAIRRRIHDEVPVHKVNRRALELLENRKAGPFFLFVHYFSPHLDYSPPPPFDTKFDPSYEKDLGGRRGYHPTDPVPETINARDLYHMVALYDGEIAYADQYVGKLIGYLKRNGLYDKMLIIFTADHGEEFYEHGRQGHKKNLFEESIHVPLIIKFPGRQWKKSRKSDLAGIVDIVPTMLEAAGIPPRPDFDGRSLLPLLRGVQQGRADPPAYYLNLDARWAAVRTEGWMLVVPARSRGHQKLFDLARDPHEKNNVAETMTARTVELEGVLARWRERAAAESARIGTASFEYTPELDKALKGLGYVD